MNGLISYIFLEFTKCCQPSVSSPRTFIDTCHETIYSLTPVMKGIKHRNSLIPIMNLYSNRNLPLLAIFPTAIAIVSDPSHCSNITTPSMYSRGSGARRSRPYPGAPSSSSHRAGAVAVAAHPGQRTSTARPVPHVNPKITPQGKARMYEEQRENTYRDRLCPMCSDSSTPIYHQHFSTTDIRRMFLEQYTREKKDMVQQTYMCPICSELEPVLFPSSETKESSAGLQHHVWYLGQEDAQQHPTL